MLTGMVARRFEIMTLVQTGKHPVIPIVLFGKEYWNKVVHFKAMAEMGTINASDLDNVLGPHTRTRTRPAFLTYFAVWHLPGYLPSWLFILAVARG